MLNRGTRIGLVAGTLLALMLGSTVALACRTTTCALKQPPPGCSRDPVTGCLLAGEPLQWREGCVSFSVDRRGASLLGGDFATTELLVSRAFALWPTASCATGFPTIAVQSFGPHTCTSPEYNPTGPNANAVVFYAEGWPHELNVLGLTTVSFDTKTGQIRDVDIELNVAAIPSTNALEGVLAHEAGHFFGLDHPTQGDALMNAAYSLLDFEAPTLSAYDVGSICAAYPPERLTAACDFEPELGYASDCGGDVVGHCGVVLRRAPLSASAFVTALLLATLALRRRPRVSARKHSSRQPK